MSNETVEATCPECEGKVPIKPDTQKNEIISCPDCGVDLEVIAIILAAAPALAPTITLALAPQEAEDWGE